MPKKYVAVRMHIEAYKKFCVRKVKLENVASKITKKQIKIPLTKVFTISAENTINLPDDYVIKVAKKLK